MRRDVTALFGLIALAGLAYWVLLKLGYHAITHWPFFVK